MRSNRPKISDIIFLRCIHCHDFPLRKDKKWFEFHRGCPSCDYSYEREDGYFTGAIWVINYAISSFLAIGTAIILMLFFAIPALVIALISAVVATFFALLLFPFSRAIWMYGDHIIHPLEEHERLKKEET